MPDPDLMTRLRRLGGADAPAPQHARDRAREQLRALPRAGASASPASTRRAGGSGAAERRRPWSGRARAGAQPRRSRGRRPGLLVLVLAAAFAAAGAGYAALHSGGGPDLSAGIGCQDRASLTPDASTQAPLDGRSAIAICAELWRRGHVDGTPTSPAPPLQACVVRGGGGAIRVMPGESAATCEALGLESRPRAGGSPAQRRYAAFHWDTIRSVHRGPPRCVTPAEGERLVRATIAEHRMTGWTIETGGGIAGEGFSDVRPCVSLAFDSARRVVVLVPMTADPP